MSFSLFARSEWIATDGSLGGYVVVLFREGKRGLVHHFAQQGSGDRANGEMTDELEDDSAERLGVLGDIEENVLAAKPVNLVVAARRRAGRLTWDMLWAVDSPRRKMADIGAAGERERAEKGGKRDSS